MAFSVDNALSAVSLPLRERGLKSLVRSPYSGSPEVAPLAGAWIEIAWISFSVTAKPSLPLRERGLKYLKQQSVAHTRRCRSPCGSVD